MLRIASLVIVLLLPVAASAATLASNPNDAYLVPYFGIFDMTNDNARNTPQFGLEYRMRDVWYGVRPTFGFNFDTDGGAYGYGGLNWEIPLGNFQLTPNFMAGLYHEGDSKDLGGAVEFRSGIELSYQLENQHRVGIAFNHISNASIYNKNPGAETTLINYAIPISALWGK